MHRKTPACGILADKATIKKRTNDIGMVTGCHKNLIQIMYLSNDIVKNYSGEGTAKDICCGI